MNAEQFKISQRYQLTSQTDLAELIQKTLEQRTQPPDPDWRAWLIAYCLYDLRPHSFSIGPKDWCRWLAFVLRYIQPLILNQPPLQTSPLLQVMKQRPDVQRTLLFGSPEQMRHALELAYELTDDYRNRLPEFDLRPEQQAFLDKVRESLRQASDRTLIAWSRHYLDSTDDRLVDRIYALFHPAAATPLPSLLQVITQPGKQRSESGARFDTYLTRTLQTPSKEYLVAQVLGYLNEFERRNALMDLYSRLFLRGALLLFVLLLAGVLLLLPTGDIGQLIVTICWALGLVVFVALTSIAGVLAFYLYDTYTWTHAALATLERLMGPVGNDADKPPTTGPSSAQR